MVIEANRGRDKVLLGISSCLLGNNVRYDGGHALDRHIKERLGKYFRWFPVCPEREYGLPVPRDPMILRKTGAGLRLLTIERDLDHTDGLLNWASGKTAELALAGLCGFIFKSKSPSCGLDDVKIYAESGVACQNPDNRDKCVNEIIFCRKSTENNLLLTKGQGLFSQSFRNRFPDMPVSDETRLHEPAWCEDFLARVLAYKRCRDHKIKI